MATFVLRVEKTTAFLFTPVRVWCLNDKPAMPLPFFFYARLELTQENARKAGQVRGAHEGDARHADFQDGGSVGRHPGAEVRPAEIVDTGAWPYLARG